MTEKICIRVSDFDKQFLKNKAKESKTTVSHIMRTCMLIGILKIKNAELQAPYKVT